MKWICNFLNLLKVLVNCLVILQTMNILQKKKFKTFITGTMDIQILKIVNIFYVTVVSITLLRNHKLKLDNNNDTWCNTVTCHLKGKEKTTFVQLIRTFTVLKIFNKKIFWFVHQISFFFINTLSKKYSHTDFTYTLLLKHYKLNNQVAGKKYLLQKNFFQTQIKFFTHHKFCAH